MKTSDTIDKLAPALAKAQASFRPVGKSGENKFDRYAYATLEDYVRAVSSKLAEHGFSVLTSVEEVTRLEDRATQKGGREHAAQIRLVLRLVHESGQWIEGEAFGEGQDRADKSIYKAITGARKYALASMLGLATTDDPEADETVGQTTGPAPTQRQVPTNGNGKRTTAKDAAVAAIEKWSGVGKDHLLDAIRDSCRAAGVEVTQGKQLTDAEWQRVSAWTRTQAETGIDFAEAVGIQVGAAS